MMTEEPDDGPIEEVARQWVGLKRTIALFQAYIDANTPRLRRYVEDAAVPVETVVKSTGEIKTVLTLVAPQLGGDFIIEPYLQPVMKKVGSKPGTRFSFKPWTVERQMQEPALGIVDANT